jgi:hypothetical protein
LLLIIMGGIYVFQFHKIPWRMVGISLAIGLPWLLFASLYFGSPLPHSMIAKRSTYGLPPLTALRSLLGYLSAYTLPVAGIELTRSMKYGFVIFVSLLAGMAEVARPRELRPTCLCAVVAVSGALSGILRSCKPPSLGMVRVADHSTGDSVAGSRSFLQYAHSFNITRDWRPRR